MCQLYAYYKKTREENQIGLEKRLEQEADVYPACDAGTPFTFITLPNSCLKLHREAIMKLSEGRNVAEAIQGVERENL